MSSDKGAYEIDSIEYIPPAKLPPNPLLDDPAELAALIAQIRQSITDQEAP